MKRTNSGSQHEKLSELAATIADGHTAQCFTYANGYCNCGYEQAILDIIEPAADAAATIESLQAEVKRLEGKARTHQQHSANYRERLVKAEAEVERLRDVVEAGKAYINDLVVETNSGAGESYYDALEKLEGSS